MSSFFLLVAVITFLLVGALVWSEISYFLNPGFKFSFVPDADFEAKLSINIDMTIAMTCDCKECYLYS